MDTTVTVTRIDKNTIIYNRQVTRELENKPRLPPNPHFIRLITGVATKEQIEQIVDRAIKYAKDKIVPDLKPNFIVNVVMNHENKYMGISLLWVDDERFGNLLLGNTPEGKPRLCKRIINPIQYMIADNYLHKPKLTNEEVIWILKESDRYDMLAELERTNKLSWAMIQECEDCLVEMINESIVETKLEPLVKLGRYKPLYNIENIKNLLLYEGTMEIGTIGLEYKQPTIPDISTVYPNVIISDPINLRININKLYDIFSRYSTMSGYPRIGFERDRLIIEYHPNTYDATYALEMHKRLNIDNIQTRLNYKYKNISRYFKY